ncbi:uncharacterized protein GLRG_01871 [Colletotrichum graminicola M1.001]|uniref:Uncharacterized protein n=1 Tax=Colletotrichum graminicola (strain M1.001 / M2 / FGSC 10212) TaxID=645133 RepID=E3Q9J7_COLGM|nr:uncharacterized protein GLRG_01871 [Colletotrichum graminicola M1.001]EFQ27376.1 hypothetical protein GLRG_01871 [Colletotrichum graminicola M1.001]
MLAVGGKLLDQDLILVDSETRDMPSEGVEEPSEVAAVGEEIYAHWHRFKDDHQDLLSAPATKLIKLIHKLHKSEMMKSFQVSWATPQSSEARPMADEGAEGATGT